MSVEAIDYYVQPNGLVPTLLVYSALSRLVLPHSAPTKSTLACAAALCNATASMPQYSTKRQFLDAVRSRDGPDTTAVDSKPIGRHALVYWHRKERWEGSFSVLDINGEDEILLIPLPPDRKSFILLWWNSLLTGRIPMQPLIHLHNSFSNLIMFSILLDPLRMFHQLPSFRQRSLVRGLAPMQICFAFPYLSFRLAFMRTPTVSMHFCVVPKSQNWSMIYALQLACNPVSRPGRAWSIYCHAGSRIIRSQDRGSQVVEWINNDDKATHLLGARLVVEAFNDKDYGMLTHDLTVQPASMRLLLCLCVIDDELEVFTREVKQAYVQTNSFVQHPIFVRPPVMLSLPSGALLRVNQPLCGLPQAIVPWFRTYNPLHCDVLNLHPSILDPCFAFYTLCTEFRMIRLILQSLVGLFDCRLTIQPMKVTHLLLKSKRLLLQFWPQGSGVPRDVRSAPFDDATINCRSKV